MNSSQKSIQSFYNHMSNLEFSDKHNMVAYLEKSEGSEGFQEIIDFLNGSHIKYALTKNPTIYVSFIKQFWRTATANTRTNGEVELTVTIDGHVKTITEAFLRRHLKLEDNDGVTSLPNSDIFEQLTLMGYATDSDKLTFQKDMQKKHLQPHTRTYDAHNLTNKVFSNMKRMSRGYSRVEVPLFPTMLHEPSTSPSRITSLPSLSPEPSPSPQYTTTSAPSTSQPQHSQPSPVVEEHVPTPHESPLYSVNSYRSDEVKKLDNQLKSGKEMRRARIVQEKQSSKKGEREISTTGVEPSTGKDGVNTASGLISIVDVSTVSEIDTTAAEKANEKGKGIMTEPEPPKKLKKRVQVQLTVDEELAKKLFEEEKARFNAEQGARAKEEQEQEKSDFKSDTIKRYQTLKRKPISVAQARKIIMIYLKNMAGYKMDYFKGMSYDDIRPIFEVEYNKVQTLFKNRDDEEEKGQKVLEESVEKTETEQVVKEVSKKTRGRRRKSLARKREKETQDEETSKRQKLDEEEASDYEKEKEELRMWMTVVLDEEATVDLEILHTKYPIVEWESQSLGSDIHIYKIIRADGNISYHKTFESMLKRFDRQDLVDLHRLVMNRFEDNTPEGYNLMLWGDLKTMFEPNAEHEVWSNQQDLTLIS
ncbi:hypothetical protein Tco_1156031 [Tanacetum coccineum]